jgi:hypothetical protein
VQSLSLRFPSTTFCITPRFTKLHVQPISSSSCFLCIRFNRTKHHYISFMNTAEQTYTTFE